MHGKLFREWLLFLKERKLYSKFIICYRAANASYSVWEREKPCFKLLNGCDYIIQDKSDSLTFTSFLCSLYTMEWYAPYMDWTSLATKFGELKGYILKRKYESYHCGVYYSEDVKQESSTVYSPKPNNRHKREREEYGKWYDRFYTNPIKNRYRR
jgi:hypothetical protein